MLIVISPAKKLDYTTPSPTDKYTIPDLLDQSQILVDILKQAPIEVLTKLMNISYGLAELNLKRYQEWSLPFTPKNAKQALFAFNGDVYEAMKPYELDQKQIDFAQKHLRILSGLYGVLRPLDLIQPYRLPMGTKLKNPRGKDLYEFWGDIITEKLNDHITENKFKYLLNLASNEYFKAVKTDKLVVPVITAIFKENRNGVYRVVSFHAKKARGLMTKYIIENNITKIEDLKGFNYEGYSFSPEQSGDTKLVFLR